MKANCTKTLLPVSFAAILRLAQKMRVCFTHTQIKKSSFSPTNPKTLGTSSCIWDASEILHTIVHVAEWLVITNLHSESTQHEHQVPKNPQESSIICMFPQAIYIINWNFFKKNQTTATTTKNRQNNPKPKQKKTSKKPTNQQTQTPHKPLKLF